MKRLILFGAISLTLACTVPAPNLTPAAVVAYHNTQIVRVLDVIRDIVDDGIHTTPAQFSQAEDVRVATWHEAALKTIHAGPNWQGEVAAGLNELVKTFPPAKQQILQHYVDLAQTLIKEFK